jgi:bifunctional DNase/RNase
MRLMVVKGVMHRSDNHTAMLKLETATADLRLELAIPHDEANRLVRILGAVGCRCTPIYETLLDFAEGMAASLARAVLDAGTEGVSASLVFGCRGSEIAVTCHPADAVALALRTQAPIYAMAGALAQAYPIGQHTAPQEQEDITHWLERLRPSDFETR